MDRKKLPIGYDDFREIREQGFYYIDKSLMIRDFIETGDTATLIVRPQHFGKTLGMTMMREFFDIMADSREIFDGLAIMQTPYAGQINSCPVIFLTFKNCKGSSSAELIFTLKQELLREYRRFKEVVEENLNQNSYDYEDYWKTVDILKDKDSAYIYLTTSLANLTRIVSACFKKDPILLIDEYDQPILSSYEYGYENELGTFFSIFLGSALKGNPSLAQALLTGIQHVAKRSIFSDLNNLRSYTVMNRHYASYFGLTIPETTRILNDYGLEFNEDVRRMYSGYQFAGIEICNPWSILNYADNRVLNNYWTNISYNYLIRQALTKTNENFWRGFDSLLVGKETTVWLDLDTSYVEREGIYTLRGLLVNTGYLTVLQRIDAMSAVVRIPNDEVMSELLGIVTEICNIEGQGLEVQNE